MASYFLLVIVIFSFSASTDEGGGEGTVLQVEQGKL